MGCDTLALSVVDFVVAITMHSPALARLRSPNSSGALRTWPRCVPTGTVAAHRPRLHTIVHALEDDDEEETVEYGESKTCTVPSEMGSCGNHWFPRCFCLVSFFCSSKCAL
jgi:hypothetical protein